MSKKFYIADTHFGHENVIKFDGRPFVDIDDMNTTMRDNWNDVIGKDLSLIHISEPTRPY